MSAVKKAKVAILLLHGFGSMDELQQVYDLGVTIARVACHCTEAEVTEQHLQFARRLGMFSVGYLISCGMTSPERIVVEAWKPES